MEITYADIAWLVEEEELGDLWCLTYVKGLDEAEALRRMGAEADSVRPLTYEALMDEGLFQDTALAARLDEWTVLIEVYGWQATESAVLRALSAGTEVVSVLRHDYYANEFAYAVDGELVTCFNYMHPTQRYGSDPDRLVDVMREVGFDPGREGDRTEDDKPIDRALRLAARLTGVVLTQEVLGGCLMGGVIYPHA
ncbi:DUF6461 domain-containing protein [Sphaerisporangium fuscum]|uniref:DUF6461 domain-containing protein n=1 Tax=Sphaerisporangium fuscum TaxID=2835868 RepID=UPI001BDBE794|nr:DUF6461 domain-containing protein [Sphaerisporangium fuscum]